MICDQISSSRYRPTKSYTSSKSLMLCRSFSRSHAQIHKSHASSNSCQSLSKTTSFYVLRTKMLCKAKELSI